MKRKEFEFNKHFPAIKKACCLFIKKNQLSSYLAIYRGSYLAIYRYLDQWKMKRKESEFNKHFQAKQGKLSKRNAKKEMKNKSLSSYLAM